MKLFRNAFLPILPLLILCCSMLVAQAAEKPTVFVSIAPQRFFVERIAGGLVNVEVLVSPGANPHTYEPKPSQMKALTHALAYFAIGVDFEHVWLKRIGAANPDMKIVHTDAGIEKLLMAHHHHDDLAEEEHDGHEHGDMHEHGNQDDHEPGHDDGTDPHVWLAPSPVKLQARSIAGTLKVLFPDRTVALDRNLAGFIAEVDALDQQLKTILAGKRGMEFMVFHPSWGYFAADYGLRQVPVEISGKDPKPAQVEALIRHAREHGITVLFAQPQLSTKTAAIIAREIDGEVIMIDPLAEDWMANMTTVAKHLQAAVK